MFQVVVDNILNDALCLFAVAHKLTLRHIDCAVVLPDCVRLPLFAFSGVLAYGDGAFAALIVECGVWLVGGEAHAVGCFFRLNGASEASRNDKE